MFEHQRSGHESPKGPTVYRHTIGINIGQRFEVFYAHQLVFHFHGSQLTMDHIFKRKTPLGRTSIVQSEDQIALIGGVVHPQSGIGQPTVVDHLGMWPTINIDDDGIFFVGIKINWFDHPRIQGRAVACFEFQQFGLADGVIFVGIVGLEQDIFFFAFCGQGTGDVGCFDIGILIDEKLARCTQSKLVHPCFFYQLFAGFLPL